VEVDAVPTECVPIEVLETATVAAISLQPLWKTYRSKPIAFPKDKDPEYIILVYTLLPN
jgi:hypothetical protein